jgi:hypothetical protein
VPCVLTGPLFPAACEKALRPGLFGGQALETGTDLPDPYETVRNAAMEMTHRTGQRSVLCGRSFGVSDATFLLSRLR